jgi:uncharacterized protein YutE (UPF0331/DUF86 family)
MVDLPLVSRKLKAIEVYVAEVEREPLGDFEAFRANTVRKRFVERNLELAVEKMVDVCRHLVSALDLQEPETYADCFQVLGESGVIAPDIVATFQKMARFRNLLVHGYDSIEDRVTYDVARERLSDFRLFVRVIREYLGRTKQPE